MPLVTLLEIATRRTVETVNIYMLRAAPLQRYAQSACALLMFMRGARRASAPR